MLAKRMASWSTDWADRRTGGKADRNTHATSPALAVRPSASRPFRRIVEIDSKFVPRDKSRTLRKEPNGLPGHPQPCQLHDHLRQQPVLHFEHPCGERVRCVVPADRHGPLRDDRTPVVLLV